MAGPGARAGADPAGETIDVMVVDGRRLVVESLAAALGQVGGLRVVATAGSLASALELARSLRPNVVLVDSRLPDATAAEATAALSQAVRQVSVIVLNEHDDEMALAQALDAGCRGFVATTRALDELVAAVRAVHGGDVVVPQPLLARVLIRGAAPERQGLTQREVDVLRMLAQGATNAAIGAELHVTVHTVRNHTQSILRKLGAHSRLEAVSAAIREGIVPPPS